MEEITPGLHFAVLEEGTGEIVQTGTFTTRTSYVETAADWPSCWSAEGIVDGAEDPVPLDLHAMGMTSSRRGEWATRFTIPYPHLH